MENYSKEPTRTGPGSVTVDSVVEKLSPERLTKYLHRVGNDRSRALDLYVWNHDIGAALSFLLQQFEVCLRNSIGRALSDRWGPDWHRKTAFTHMNKDITALYTKTHDKAQENCRVKAISNCDFIAAASLSFWREVCKPHWIGEIWAKRLPLTFPHMVLVKNRRDNLVKVHSKIDLLVKLRNRIAHHEPIIGNNHERLAAKLEDRHHDLIEMLGWIDTDFCQWTATHDRFIEVMHTCPLSR